SVAQAPLSVSVEEGRVLSVSCSYNVSAASYSLQWYRQERTGAPEYLLQRYKAGSDFKELRREGLEHRFSSSLDSSARLTVLLLQKLRLSDSAVYYCALRPTVTQLVQPSVTNTPHAFSPHILLLTVNARQYLKHFTYMTLIMTAEDSITPLQTQASGKEGKSVTLSCSYDTSDEYVYLFWYRQYSDQPPQYILRKGARSYSGTDTAEFAKARFSSTAEKTSTTLTISSLTVGDTAVYLCALR
uniref:Ig-like domain-containing protein n=1 Tax=Lepisosteus oculatus TaxID=7918 RepID=W5MGG7_LEPOC